MIDINKLRRLTQAATPGPWKLGQYLGSPRQFVIHMDVGDKGRGSDVAFTSAAFGNDETIANASFIAAANPAAISELLDRLEAAEKETASWKGLAKQFGNEADALRAKIERMGKQEPVAWTTELALRHGASTLGFDACRGNLWGDKGVPLYTLPCAKGEEK